ncbi:MAG: cell surface protein, partial [Flavobacteriaceae bacterium CG_4_8_14_3_um_filter_31_8]
ITSIGNNAFYNCNGLKNVTVNLATPLTIDATVFEYVNLSGASLKVPSNSVSTYKAAAIWKNFGTINAL